MPCVCSAGGDDDTVRNSSAHYIFDNVSSQVKRLKFYDASGHLMLWSPAAYDAIRDIEAFLDDME